MSCAPIRLKDGTVVLVNLKPGAALTDDEARVLEEYLLFCRRRKARRAAKEQRERNKQESHKGKMHGPV